MGDRCWGIVFFIMIMTCIYVCIDDGMLQVGFIYIRIVDYE